MKNIFETVRAIEDAGFTASIRTRKFSGDDMPAGCFSIDARRAEDGDLVECCPFESDGKVKDHMFAYFMTLLKKARVAK
ncbi:hypothetical protein RAD16_32720 [Bradyrhizobium sp. 18BD]